MEQEELEQKMQIVAAKAKLIVMQAAPVRTGNLMNSIKIIYTSTGFTVYVDTTIAPYMEYTEGVWSAARWHGRANPNEGWFKEAARQVANMVAATLGSTAIET